MIQRSADRQYFNLLEDFPVITLGADTYMMAENIEVHSLKVFLEGLSKN
ncbi:MAG: hypothetical protein OEX02_11635 [Cyclobacteriaceae bacterium]|nr:hypothetical protein [Cyclobacteriaceae bacterium]